MQSILPKFLILEILNFATCIPILKISLHNRANINNTAFSAFLCLICRHSQCKSVRKVILYSAIGWTIMTINALFDF